MLKLKILLPLIITLAILFFILNSLGYKEVYTTLRSGNIVSILIALILFFTTLLILSLRWYTILRAHNINISYPRILGYYLGSVSISKISPSNSGDLVRALYLKDNLSLSSGVGIVILENLLDISVLLALVFIGSIVSNKFSLTAFSLALILAIAGILKYGAKIKIKNGKWKSRINNFFSTKEKITHNPKLLFTILVFSLVPWLILIFCIKLFFLAFGTNIPYLTILATQPLAIFLGLIPITFSGIGVRESAMLYLYSIYAKQSTILAVGLTYSFTAAIFLPLLCLPFLMYALRNKII